MEELERLPLRNGGLEGPGSLPTLLSERVSVGVEGREDRPSASRRLTRIPPGPSASQRLTRASS